MARVNSNQQDDHPEDGELRSDDVQDGVVQIVNESPSAAIPIPLRPDEDGPDSDLERGQDSDDRVNERQETAPRSAWRNIVSGGVSALSGDTVWRQSPTARDRSR